MESDDIAAVVGGFVAAARIAAESGTDGVEINAGQHSLIRQFLSGLTNHRDDEWGQDRLRFARDVIAATRAALGDDRILGVRLSCDELAPWAGITPEMAPEIAAALVGAGADYLVVVRGAIFSVEKTRPDFHEPTGFNVATCRTARDAVEVPVVLQGSVVEWGQAEWALGGFDDPAVCDLVEMTRAQIADPDLVAKLARDDAGRIRPCTLCNQTCQVRDARNPIVTCVGEPTSGRETEDPDWYTPAKEPRRVVVIGGGPAGLETARVAAIRGHRVTVLEANDQLGGLARVAGPHAALVDWLRREHEHLDTDIRSGVDARQVDAAAGGTPPIVVQCTGSRPGRPTYEIGSGVEPGEDLIDVADLRLEMADLPPDGPVVIHDPIGGPIGVALAEELESRAILITPDNVAGNELARTGDLAPANTRLQQAGVTIHRRSLLRMVRRGPDGVVAEIEDRYSGERTVIECDAVVDCGFRLPDEPLDGVDHRAGDAVAPRTVFEAILEGRRIASSI